MTSIPTQQDLDCKNRVAWPWGWRLKWRLSLQNMFLPLYLSKFCHFQNIMMDILVHRILSIWNYHYLGKVNWNDGLGLKCIFWRDKTFCHLRLNLMKYIKCAYSCPSLDIYLVILKMQTSQVLRYISLIQMDCMIACDQYHWCFFQNLDFYEFCSVGLNIFIPFYKRIHLFHFLHQWNNWASTEFRYVEGGV